ncbi:hypothetical protein H112_04301 [Trichophyton rubrum D6]|uniref:Uncharacterized protein n=4 Tax=Trichophyton TaxID=5550 RepID=F2SPS8_TRIRC|nr:uncharacterized protein TERG_04077 [Trichophyton rubrum CBS 118892]EZF22797.1 hypothetical protein H100_04309 [Trichophyton rubrum MR850]EZF42048.1 hypothetical protein H102_04293 [Trichophyton rubrum CBS 100081]EZF52659.1 hypothetical protein H103_04302 [Trichophyton rubrum CBS 288.86]EZF63254.1 hypothetical protein H104_04291 [Trichophyton rubrum CBS 289.86]EZF73987.1 hypothetical protein H105_04318 [Trichophyton soudanense CBS 452.61]EZF84589.1 hypothetical protein H110_04296 [Trichophy
MSDEISYNQEPAPHPQNLRAQSKTSSMETKCEPPKTGQSTPSKITPRPTYISGAAAASDLKLPQQMLSKRNTIDINDYFKGPRNLDRHSKWPLFLRVHGSVMPRMIIPLLLMTCWSTLITCVTRLGGVPLGIDSTLLTVLGFVVGLALSLRSSTAYERYGEGRKYWASLMQNSRTLARIIWIHKTEREGEEGKEDIISKLTGINLIVAFAVALKHKLRFEPGSGYEDISGLIDHLDTFAKAAHDPDFASGKKPGMMKALGQYLSIPMAMSNPRKQIKRSDKPLGNLPAEILNYLSAYIHESLINGSIPMPVHQSQAGACLNAMEEVMTGNERVLNTPLPLAYTILISQITWLYVLALPFQLVNKLEWVAIPGTIAATYIIHGIASICAEIENPFGDDVNDLPLDVFCQQLAADLDIITSTPPAKADDFINREHNYVLYPLSKSSVNMWKDRSVEDIRAALKAKATLTPARLNEAGSRDIALAVKGQDESIA